MVGTILKAFPGTTLAIPVVIEDDDRNPINISGASVRFSIGGEVIETTAGVSVSIDGPNGAISIIVPDTVLGRLNEGSHKIGVEIIYASGMQETLLQGNLILEAESPNKTLVILNDQKIIQNLGGTIRISPGNMGKRTMAIVNFWPSKTSGFDKTDYVEMPNNKQTFQVKQFLQGVKSFGEISVPMPKRYDGGALRAAFHWSANSTSANKVRLGIRACAYADGEALDRPWGAAVEVTDTNGSVAYQERISSQTASFMPAGTPGGGRLLQLRIYRDGTNGAEDTLAATMNLLAVDIEYGIL